MATLLMPLLEASAAACMIIDITRFHAAAADTAAMIA